MDSSASIYLFITNIQYKDRQGSSHAYAPQLGMMQKYKTACSSQSGIQILAR